MKSLSQRCEYKTFIVQVDIEFFWNEMFNYTRGKNVPISAYSSEMTKSITELEDVLVKKES